MVISHNNVNSTSMHKARYVTVVTIMILCLSALLWRMVDLTVIDRQFLQKQGDARSIRTIPLVAYRGMITDRNGEPLAVSSPVESVWINPQALDINSKKVAELAQQLNIPTATLQQLVSKAAAADKEFIYIKRGLTPMRAELVRALKIKGVYLQREFRRYYPTGEASAHVVGFTNIDDRGQEGMELLYDNWLTGTPGAKRVIRDRLGNVIADLGTVQQANPGQSITLSIDTRIQYIAHQELAKALETTHAKSGSVVVLDAESGEVLAMANQPTFNPNAAIKNTGDGRYRNRAVTDLFEPGSVIKAFTIASALESGHFRPDTMIDTAPGWMVVNGNTVRDIRNYGAISLQEAMLRSSNVAMTKMTLIDEEPSLYDMLARVGFGQATASLFPGERDGVLHRYPSWKRFDWATLSFGYGMSLTPLQLTQAFTVFANQGKLVPVTLLKESQARKAQQVMSAQVADDVLQIMQEVVEGGTGRRARVQGYTVAGKTGTSRVLGPQGYDSKRHVSTFIGLAPVDNPRLIICVVIHEPTVGGYYGSQIAAPVFSKIMAGALRILEVMPDSV